MGQVRPLRLKAQKYGRANTMAMDRPIAQILVDTPAIHLESTYDYLVSEEMSQAVVPGALVKVPFGSQEVQGYVIERLAETTVTSALKYVDAVITPLSILSPNLLKLLTSVGNRYGVRPWDLIRSAIPERVGVVEKEFELATFSQETSQKTNRKVFRRALVGNLSEDIFSQLTYLVEKALVESSVLIVVPDEKSVRRLVKSLSDRGIDNPLELGSHLSRSDRYRNFLKSYNWRNRVIIGTRSAIFAEMPPGSTIVVLRDNDESMYEKRSPGWNVRDIALLRASEHSLIFLSLSPSLEIQRLIDISWLKTSNAPKRKSWRITTEGDRRTSAQIISEGLRHGPVLIGVSEPGYVNSFLCSNCRNRAECKCGGKLYFPRIGSTPRCAICELEYPDWKCTWCGIAKPSMIKRGAGRHAVEFGKAFPGFQVITSTGDHAVAEVEDEPVLIVATSGCEPHGSYAAAVLLDGLSLFNRTGLRSDEVARERWLNAISMVKERGEIFLSLAHQDYFVQSLLRGAFTAPAITELTNRESAKLPPFYRMAILEAEISKINRIYRGLITLDQFEVNQPLANPEGRARLVVRTPVERGDELSKFVMDLQRHESLKGGTDLTIRLDPYSI